MTNVKKLAKMMSAPASKESLAKLNPSKYSAGPKADWSNKAMQKPSANKQATAKAVVMSKMTNKGGLAKAEKGEKPHTGASDTSLSGKAWNIHDPKGDAKFKSGFEEASRRAKENRMK